MLDLEIADRLYSAPFISVSCSCSVHHCCCPLPLDLPRERSLCWQPIWLSVTGSCHTRFHWTNTAVGWSCGLTVSGLMVCPDTVPELRFLQASQGHSFIQFRQTGQRKKVKEREKYLLECLNLSACRYMNSSACMSHSCVSPCLCCMTYMWIDCWMCVIFSDDCAHWPV